MSAHRYWRAAQINTYATGALAVSEFHLLSGITRVDAAAIVSSSSPPDVGAIGDIQDVDLATGATWPGVAGLTIVWDFGPAGDVDVTDIRLGAADSTASFPLSVVISFSDDATAWTDYALFAGITWPGARKRTSSSPRVLPATGATVTLINVNLVKGRVQGYRPQWAAARGREVSTGATIVRGLLRAGGDFLLPGRGQIVGTVKIDGSPIDAPVRRRVRLHRDRDGRLIREVWSDPVTGAYSFDNIEIEQKYTVISYDYRHDFRAVIADNITPEPMP